MATEKTDRISNFPNDGAFWWVRWVDHYRVPHGPTGTPSVDVLLSRLPKHPLELAPDEIMELVKDTASFMVVPELVGSIPRLGLGRVFLDGMEVGELPTAVETFTINLRGDDRPLLFKAGDEMEGRPQGWKYPYRVLNSYRIGKFLDSKCWVAKSGTTIVVLPCQEAFRAFFAPETEMALALTGAPWVPTARNRLANPDGSGVTEDGAWHVVLRPRVHDLSQLHLANLICSDAGRTAAARIYTSLLATSGAAPIEAHVPFDSATLTFTARCLKLHRSPDKFLVLEILRADWPYPNQIVRTRRDNGSEDGEVVQLTGDPPPYVKQPRPPRDGGTEEAPIPVTPDDAPDGARPKETFNPHPLVWGNAPVPEELRKDVSYRYERKPPVEAPPPEAASAGNPTGSDTGLAPGTYVPEINAKASSRFQDVVEMMGRLLTAGDIRSWSVMANPVYAMHRGALSVWTLPLKLRDDRGDLKTYAWSYLDREEGTRRTALLCEVELPTTDKLYWLEIELRPNEGGHRSLLFTTPQKYAVEVIRRLLISAVLHHGVWQSAAAICNFTRASDALAWKHSYVTAQETPESPKESRLSDQSALAAMKKLLGIDDEEPSTAGERVA